MIEHLPPVAHAIALVLAIAVVSVGLLQNLIHAVQLALAARALRKAPPEPESDALWRRYGEAAPPVSVLAPAYNEEATIAQSVHALLTVRYPNVEVIIINDGSTDATLQVLIETFDLRLSERRGAAAVQTEAIRGVYVSEWHPRLVVIDKANGGKADALNAGVNLSRAPLFCAIDADSVLEPDALLRAVQPFLEDPEQVIAVGGTICVGNGCSADRGAITKTAAPQNSLALFQAIEYVRAFLLARLGWSGTGALTIISGAFGVFRRSIVVEAGGYARGTVGEDMELVLRLHRRARDAGRHYKILFVPEPVCWTEAPESLTLLGRQRRRWQRGAIETFQRHLPMLFNPRYGRVGWLGMGSVLILDILGPIAEFLGYLLAPAFGFLGLLSWQALAAFVCINLMFGIGLSCAESRMCAMSSY